MKNAIADKRTLILKAGILFLIVIGGFQTINARSAITAKNRYAEMNGRKIAYRLIGKATPIIFCNRFRPKSEASRRAAALSNQRIAQRTEGLSVPVPKQLWSNYFRATADFGDDKTNLSEKLGALKTPVLVMSGDHDVVCPIENWYALTGKLPNMQIIMLPDAGHVPQHQYPELSVKYINAFLQSTKR